jgi:hypothetical protein
MRSMRPVIVAITMLAIAAAVSCSSGGPGSTSRLVGIDASAAPQQIGPADTIGESVTGRVGSAVTVTAWPNAECEVHRFGDQTDPMPLFADELGFVRFAAVHRAPNEEGTALSLDCHDDSGRTATYTLDLTSPRTFEQPPPVPPEKWPPGSLRAPLKGDPLAYSQNQLKAMGFPRRPDPLSHPAQYSNWLSVASKPARRVLAKAHKPPPGTGAWTTTFYGNWAGSILSAQQCSIDSGCEPPYYW